MFYPQFQFPLIIIRLYFYTHLRKRVAAAGSGNRADRNDSFVGDADADVTPQYGNDVLTS